MSSVGNEIGRSTSQGVIITFPQWDWLSCQWPSLFLLTRTNSNKFETEHTKKTETSRNQWWYSFTLA